MLKKFTGLFVLFILSIASIAQTNVAHTRISIITCGPGEDLYSLFGHTAIRIVDSSTHSDIVYNWGGFTFDQPNFYLKFLRGQLLYYSSADNYSDFLYEYIYENRSVYEQVLNLDSASKLKIINAINFNMQGENKFYKYNFLLDNCTTRVRDIVFENNKDFIIKDSIVPANTTARDMIHYYLDRGGEPWTKLGIDILLGSRVDWVVSNTEAMFMPEFLMKGLSSSYNDQSPFVIKQNRLLQGEAVQHALGPYLPLIIIGVNCLIIFILSRLKTILARKIISIIDALLLYVTGLLGLLLLFMWFATDHTVCKNNFNLAWAFPLNFFVAFFLIRKPNWLGNYFLIMAVITAVFLGAWFFIPQEINIALLPFVLLLLNRYVALANSFKRMK
ncbi:MAG: DUF4105 domain-containing protein [Bacteroidetes bacterium]|nr:DUF4105 domain-containing protein [Bacteroidota bacterium]